MTVDSFKTAVSNTRAYERSLLGLTRQNHHCSVAHTGPLVAIRPKAVPAVAEFEAWLSEAHPNKRESRFHNVDGGKLRRMVVMRGNGCNNTEIARSVGISNGMVGKWLSEIPTSLGGQA